MGGVSDRFTFGWLTNTIRYNRPVELAFSKQHLREQLGPSQTFDPEHLLGEVARRFRRPVLTAALLKLVSDVLVVGQVRVIAECMRFIKELVAAGHGVWSAGLHGRLLLLLAMQLANTLCMNHQEYLMTRSGLSVRMSLINQVFAAALLGSRLADSGQLTNLVSADVHAVEAAFGLLHFMWSAPLQSGLILWQLYATVGSASLLGLAVLLLYLPVQALAASVLRGRKAVPPHPARPVSGV